VLPWLHPDMPQTPHSCVLATAAPAVDVVLGLVDALIAAWAHAGTHPVRLALFSRDLQCARQLITVRHVCCQLLVAVQMVGDQGVCRSFVRRFKPRGAGCCARAGSIHHTSFCCCKPTARGSD
jgi:hypothetical protein